MCVCVSVCVWTQGLGAMGGAADGPSWCVTSMATALRAQPRFWQEFPLTFVRVRRVEGGVYDGWCSGAAGSGQAAPSSLPSQLGIVGSSSQAPSSSSSLPPLSSQVLGPGLAPGPKV